MDTRPGEAQACTGECVRVCVCVLVAGFFKTSPECVTEVTGEPVLKLCACVCVSHSTPSSATRRCNTPYIPALACNSLHACVHWRLHASACACARIHVLLHASAWRCKPFHPVSHDHTPRIAYMQVTGKFCV